MFLLSRTRTVDRLEWTTLIAADPDDSAGGTIPRSSSPCDVVGMHSTVNNWIQSISATDGGYFLVSFPPDPPLDREWEPSVFPEQPGEVLADGPVASINILNDDDERVLLACIAVNQAPSPREIQSRTDQGAHVATFTLEAVGPIQVLSNDLEEQVTLVPQLTTPTRLECLIYMVLEPDLLEPGDPVEQHHLRMWPADRDLQHRTHWWTR